jgi:phage baseplate assembly protein W
MAILRDDYAFPFRIDPASRQAQGVAYETHVKQMVIQLLLTAPGERADLPEFGCGLRTLIFAGNSDAVSATAQMLVREALGRWLSRHLTVLDVEVLPPEATPEENRIVVRVEYVLLATLESERVDVTVT